MLYFSTPLRLRPRGYVVPDLVPLHAASRIGAHKVVFLQNDSVCENETNEPRAVRRTSLRAASRAHEVLCTPNSTVGSAHITATYEKRESRAKARQR